MPSCVPSSQGVEICPAAVTSLPLPSCIDFQEEATLPSSVRNRSQTSNDTNFISFGEVQELLKKVELSIRSELNLRLLNLEGQVAKLLQTLQEKSKPIGPSSPHPRGLSLHYTQPSRSRLHKNSNQLPFRIIWGTPSNCSTRVVSKAICALLPTCDASSLVVKRSVRSVGSRNIWWFTLIAPLLSCRRLKVSGTLFRIKHLGLLVPLSQLGSISLRLLTPLPLNHPPPMTIFLPILTSRRTLIRG